MPSVSRYRVSGLRIAALVVLAILMSRSQAGAQAGAGAPLEEARISPFAIDARFVLAGYGPTEEQAAALGYAVTDLPGTGMGVDIGGHWYPVHWSKATLGIGGNVMLSAGHSNPTNNLGQPTGNTADTALRSVASQVSMNFGSRAGWSYLSAGLGYSTFTTATPTTPAPDNPARRMTINFGGGARFFTRDHLAFTFDMRFYRMSPQAATEVLAAAAGTTRFVFGVGASFR